MYKIKKVLVIFLMFISILVLTGCDELLGSLGDNTGNTGNPGIYNEAETLLQIYNLSVRQGYEGTYEEWIESLKGESVEFRVSDGAIQWKYSSSGTWTTLYEIETLRGEEGKDGTDGEDGLTPYIGKNGHWWIGDTDTKVKADGKDGKDGTDGEDGLTPYIGKNGNWWIGDTDTKVKAEAKGAPGKSAYEAFKELYPDYEGDEAQWVYDLINGKLFEINYVYYTVKFDDGEGNVLFEQSVMNSRVATKPEDPVKQGYVFAGWYANGEKWNFASNVVLKDMTLVANWIKSSSQPNISITNVWSDKNNIYFELNEDNFCTIESIALYLDGVQLVETLDNLAKREFNNLYSNRDYKVVVTYSYDMNDGFGKQIVDISMDCRTDAVYEPSFGLNKQETTLNSFSFNLYENDYDNVGKFTKFEVYLNNQCIKTIDDIEETNVEGLLSGKEYELVVYYQYDLNDGMSTQEKTERYKFYTSEVIRPEIKFIDMESTQNQITGEVVLVDPSNITEILSVELYKGKNLVSKNTKLELNYSKLLENTKYNIVVRYKYDLYDGSGAKEYEVSYSINTHPSYNFKTIIILNPTTIVEGDTVYLCAYVENPSSAIFTQVYVNGKAYDVNPSSTSSKIYVSLHGLEAGDHK